MARCQRRDLLALGDKQRISTNHESLGVQVKQGSESVIDLLFGAGLQDGKLHPHHLCRVLQLAGHQIVLGIGSVHEKSDGRGSGHKLRYYRKPLRS
jgi:hypothetical protein